MDIVMGMPKGRKIERGYATVAKDDDGHDYRSISKVMTDAGFSMNHATARNEFLRGMAKLARRVAKSYGVEPTRSEIDRIARNPSFQSAMGVLVREAWTQEDDDGKDNT